MWWFRLRWRLARRLLDWSWWLYPDSETDRLRVTRWLEKRADGVEVREAAQLHDPSECPWYVMVRGCYVILDSPDDWTDKGLQATILLSVRP